MNLTLSADAALIEGAREWAAAHGTSINALVKDYLASLGGSADRDEAAMLFEHNARNGVGDSGGGKPFSRSELYTCKRFETEQP